MCENISHSIMSEFLRTFGLQPANFSVHRILQAVILVWVVISFPRDLPNPGIELWSPALQVDSLPSYKAYE